MWIDLSSFLAFMPCQEKAGTVSHDCETDSKFDFDEPLRVVGEVRSSMLSMNSCYLTFASWEHATLRIFSTPLEPADQTRHALKANWPHSPFLTHERCLLLHRRVSLSESRREHLSLGTVHCLLIRLQKGA